MYAARFNVYELAGVIQSTNDLQTLLPIPDDCTMPRILYSDKMLGTTNSDTLRIFGYDFCMHCTGSTINEADITGSTGFYEGIIGNPYRENELLEFCQTHHFNSIYFYGSGYLFTKPGFDINTNYTVNLTGGGSQNLITYLNEKLYNFIVRAKLNYGVQHVGIAGGDLPNMPHTENIFFRTGDFNQFQSSLQTYNYKYTGKVGQIVLEDEFWRSNDDLTGNSQTDTLFDNHKLYIKRMLTVARNDFNIRSVDDYIGRLIGDGDSVLFFYFDTTTNCRKAKTSVKSLIQSRASELEELKDTSLNRKRLNRIFMVYTPATRYPTNKEQTKASWFGDTAVCYDPLVSHCQCPDRFNDIGGVDNDCFEDSILPSLPWHGLYTSYNTMMFGHRNKHFYAGDSITRVYPIFYAEAGCLDDSLRLLSDTSDNFLGYWLATPKAGQNRTLKLAEEIFRDNFPSNFYYNDQDRGPNMRLNGFVYFHYQLLKRIHRYNIALGQQYTNFSDNNATPRIEQDTAFSDNTCFWNVPLNNGGLYGELGPGKVARQPQKHLSDMAAFPNPNKSTLTYEVSFEDKKTIIFSMEVALYDVLGKAVFNQTINGKNSGEISTLPLPKGIYFLKVISHTSTGAFVNNKTIIAEK